MSQPESADRSPFVSVVVPCYNSSKTVGECLRTLLGQHYPAERYEIILVDNGSTDGSRELVTRDFPSVRLLTSEQKGSGHARNAGIRAAQGELILSTDSDCAVAPDWMPLLVGAMRTAPQDVAAIGGRISPYSTRTAVERFRGAWVGQPDQGARDAGVFYAATPNAIFRASALRAVGGFDGTLGFDDTDLGLRLIQAGYRIQYLDEAIVRHRNPSSLPELYKHKLKYGMHNFHLARKHPAKLGDPARPGADRELLVSTSRRVIGDLLVKLPLSLVAGAGERPRIWPLIDAATAIGNYRGFRRAASSVRRKS